MNSITRFSGVHHFLSNFYPALVTLDGVDYPSVEHAYQAAKTMDDAERQAIRRAPKPGTAKALGRGVKLRADWDSMKLDVMEDLVRQKFSNSFKLKTLLLATNGAELIEGNYWGDRFWGMVWVTDKVNLAPDKPSSVEGHLIGENHLGKILMKVRDELKEKT